tara:strand:+ start:101 stop:292 length:192 start_codon:yes stop_codon:yes gene_type:complete
LFGGDFIPSSRKAQRRSFLFRERRRGRRGDEGTFRRPRRRRRGLLRKRKSRRRHGIKEKETKQ